MIGFHAEILQALLYNDSDRTTTAPDTNDEIWTKTAFSNRDTETVTVEHQVFFLDEFLYHDNLLSISGFSISGPAKDQGGTTLKKSFHGTVATLEEKVRMSEKYYMTAQSQLEDAFRLGVKVINSGFQPTVIIAIWRGGAPIGIAVQELLAYCRIQTDHIAIRTSSYTNAIDDRATSVRVHGMNYLVKNINHDDRLLIVDDVFDTGHTIEAVISHLHEKARLNTPEDIRVAVPWYKPTRNETGRVPDYYLYETEQWLKFPHSLEGLTEAEIRDNRPTIYKLVSRAKLPATENSV